MDPDLPLDVTHEVGFACLCLRAQRAARQLARVFDEVFRPLNLTNGQFSLLMSLNRPEPPRLTDLTGQLGMDRTTLTASVKVLERRGLMRQEQDEKDKRAKRLLLTDEGRALLKEAVPIWRETHARIEAELEQITAAQMRAGLDQLAGR
ncbi:MarR family winged helix-turn-helix transcriptional regulator [Vannielia litorea]|uniref:MarR family winged helix-turn-helix transcriptional regulator n=1 Tax=Vannielia litorea TaxID=1217970 RepID=UPI001BD0AC24|nr:MarR family transcriptional regulator [Vannielia litorea]MBS8225650.1 MarR family transcriptional regulator [Vannielia litorea]